MCESYTYVELLGAITLAVVGPADWHNLAIDWLRYKLDQRKNQ